MPICLRQGGWLSPGELPAYLTAALREGRIKLPPLVLVAGLETPAPLEDLWLKAVSRRTQVVHLQVRGDLANVRQAVALPDPAQELNWVAAQLVELARERPAAAPPGRHRPGHRHLYAPAAAGPGRIAGAAPVPGRLGLQFLPGAATWPKSPSFGPPCCP